jgi:hypothetical protein
MVEQKINNLKYKFKAQAKHTEIVYKLSIFRCCWFANKTKTTTWKKPKPKQKHCFGYKFGMDFVVVRTKIKKN